ncbi:MAG: M1 family aminopeptidase, partial [Bacteroidia bacterium]
FYSGELVWKERELKISQIYDALPINDRSPFISKLFALILVQVDLLFVVMFCGIIIQCCYGYFHFEIGLYLRGLFGIRLIDYALICVLSMFIQVLVNNKYVGYFVMVVYYLFSIFMGSMGLEHHLYQYASDPGMTYSALNGYGSYVAPFVWFKLYWALFATLLAIIAKLFWIRGNETSFSQRVKIAKARFTFSTKIVSAFVLIAFIGVGGFIFYNTNILNKYVTSYEQEKAQVAYEKTYKKYEHIPQPRIVAVKLNVDIYPAKKNIFFKGTYTLKNNSKFPIDSIHVIENNEAKINEMSFNVPSQKVLNDTKTGYYIYKLNSPLQPNDSIVLNMDIDFVTKGFGNSSSDLRVYHNGTFIDNSSLPLIGYDPNGELSDNEERKKFGLPFKEPMARVNDSVAHMNTYISDDADWINYEATVSTSNDQTAFTSGDLINTWTANNRNYFHYINRQKMENFYAFFSGRYEIKKEFWNNIPLSIYYHKGHEYNVDRMFRALKDGLTYYSKNFSPYQFDQMRIVETPDYFPFAQSFPNTIAFSEGIGFIADVDDSNPEDIDYPYFVTAHELAHQWWAHQVIGGNVQGSTLLSETMAQYSSMMIMKQRFGADKMKKYLKYEMNSYLIGRSTEREKELPLYLVENQGYIHYRKGSVVMYALQDYIGEDTLNSALRKYIHKVAFQYPPYTNSLQFLTFLNKAVPDSLKYIVNDMFMKITLYENKTVSATYTKTTDKKYLVHIETNSEKFTADSLGNETAEPLHDWIDIGIFTQKKINGTWTDVPIYLKKHKITAANESFDISVDELPVKAGIDPYNKLIDRHPDDNEMDVSEKVSRK